MANSNISDSIPSVIKTKKAGLISAILMLELLLLTTESTLKSLNSPNLIIQESLLLTMAPPQLPDLLLQLIKIPEKSIDLMIFSTIPLNPDPNLNPKINHTRKASQVAIGLIPILKLSLNKDLPNTNNLRLLKPSQPLP